MILDYKCKSCGNFVHVDVDVLVPGRYSGPPEQCYPDEGGEVEPQECPVCGFEILYDKVVEQANEI